MNLTLALLIGTIAIFSFGIWLFWKVFPNFDKENLAFWIGFFWLGICVFTPMILHQKYSETIEYYEESHEYYIHSLGNDKYMEGDFGLFTGTLNETDYYFFYVNYTSGMGREKLPTNNAYIKEGNYKPEVRGVYKKYRDEDKFWKIMDDFEVKYYRLYVPNNTIIRDFKVR